MNKSDLINEIAKGASVSKAVAGAMLDTTIEAIKKALKKGDRVQLAGFGGFSVSDRKAREGRNPQTGAKIKIPATKVVKFSVGKAVKEAVAGKKK